MRTMRRVVAGVLDIVAVIVLLALGLPRFGSGAPAAFVMRWMHDSTVNTVVEWLWYLLFLVALVCFVRWVLLPPAKEPASVRAAAAPDVEVTLDALLSVARAAATEEDVMVERSWGTIHGSEHDGATITLELIAFINTGLGELGKRVQERVSAACADMLGVPNVRVRVRFLPSTTTVTREVSGE